MSPTTNEVFIVVIIHFSVLTDTSGNVAKVSLRHFVNVAGLFKHSSNTFGNSEVLPKCPGAECSTHLLRFMIFQFQLYTCYFRCHSVMTNNTTCFAFMKKFHGKSEPTPRMKNMLHTAFHLQSTAFSRYHVVLLTAITMSITLILSLTILTLNLIYSLN